ncbi:MAG TPA: hypothetical protein VIW46_01250 [Acidimicrobiia bacterium]
MAVLLGELALDLVFGTLDQPFLLPAVGFAAGVMAVSGPRRRRVLAAATLVASAPASLASGVEIQTAAWSAVADVVAPLLFAWLVGSLGKSIVRLTTNRSLVAYGVAAVLSGLGGGIVSASGAVVAGGSARDVGSALWQTLAADTVGIVLLASAVAVGAQKLLDRERRFLSSGWESRAAPVVATIVALRGVR